MKIMMKMKNIKLKHLQTFENYGNQDEYRFQYNCVAPRSLEELELLIDHMGEYDTEVSKEVFLERIDFEEINDTLGGIYLDEDSFINDHHIRFYIGSTYYDDDEDFNREMEEENGEEYHDYEHGQLLEYSIMIHSAIEWVWLKE